MSREGYKRWRKKLRPRLTKIVYVPIQRIDVNVKDICNEKLLLQFMIDNFYPGYFLVKGGSGSFKKAFSNLNG